MTTDFKTTLNLPVTPFEMRANLAQKEPQFLAQWEADDLWGAICRSRAGAKAFVLHDGPPYANGALHHGHILNKVLKDIIIKDRTMAGYAVNYVPGWDCHGLPIEVQVDKELGARKASMQPHEIAAACRAYAHRFVESQKASFKRLGVLGAWDEAYRTMDAPYEAQIMRETARLMEGELIYKTLRPVHWCTVHQTALAEAEVEYADRTSPSIYVAFAAKPEGPLAALNVPAHLVIWTTTPWTLPGNVAVVVHPELTYVAYRLGERVVVVAESTLPAFLKTLADSQHIAFDANKIMARFSGAELAGVHYSHPFLPRDGQVVTDTFVETDTGTGCVHTAPGHGAEDFAVGQRLGLPTLSPVDARGVLTDEAGPFAGLALKEASAQIIAYLEKSGVLLSDPALTLNHRYAHCWRCHKPIITRATEQWFVAMDKPFAGGGSLRERAMACLADVKWVPAWGVDRIGGMLKGRPDWCLSRQRTWGVPIPILYCMRCDAPFRSPKHMRRVADRVEKEGASAWTIHDVQTLFGDVRCGECGHDQMRKETDILDVWFDSGVSYAAVLEARGIGHTQGPPADLYLEGSDQHRGWFHSSLLTSLATRERPPYRTVLTHGFVVDGQGRKISKSLGNFVDPFKAIEQEGAELWRLWVASEDYQQDVRISPEILRQLKDAYRKIRNTLRYLLGNLHGFDPSTQSLTFSAMNPLDQFAVGQAQEAVATIRAAYSTYSLHNALQRLLEWCNTDLSAFYLDVLKDRLYASAPQSDARRSAQTALYIIAQDMVRVMAPICAFTSEEAWQHLPHRAGAAKSVHMAYYDDTDASGPDAQLRNAAKAAYPTLLTSFQNVFQVRRTVLAVLEEARRDKRIGSSVQARVVLSGGAQALAPLAAFAPAVWADLLIVSQVEIVAHPDDAPLKVVVEVASGEKCPRCWLYRALVTSPDSTDTAVCARCTKALS
jgi:isoleucyl-tRNA synthetase